MSSKHANQVIEKFSDECILCGACLSACTLLSDLGENPGEIAQAISREEVSDELVAAIQRCALCGYCSQECLVNLNPAQMFKAAREILVQKGRIDPEEYDVMRVDREWNFFSIYRATYDIHFDDLKRTEYDTLFFPGCTLASYSPELTRAAFHWLEKRGLQVGFTELCCGKPLDSIGLSGAANHYLDQLRNELETSGARQIITACPNCENSLRSKLPGLDIHSIYGLMLDAGVHVTGEGTLTFHDSCPDRYGSSNPQDVRQLLSGFQQVEMKSRGKDTICCGSGGIVSMVDPELCASRAQKRMAEFFSTRADTCVTACMACSHRLAQNIRAGQVRHCLEYVFDIQVDYEQVEKNTIAMWEGRTGEINLARLAQAHELSAEEEKNLENA